MDLKRIFYNLQKQMISKLSTDRELLTHPTTKGDATEINWIDWLRIYLPKRYSVDKAFIIDSNNQISQQIDLVIYDQQYSPFVFNQDGAIYIPAESVYAVFEVKQEINKQYIEYAGEKIKSVRTLNRTSYRIIHADGCIDKPKTPFRILAGILTLDSSWIKPFDSPFKSAIESLDNSSQIDLGCVLKKGSFKISYIPSISFEISTEEEALIYFFLKLLIELQNLGTVPAMDIISYARVLDSI